MKSFVIAAMAAASLLVGGVAHASADKANAAGCMKCHDVDKKKMASSFKDIAAKNKAVDGQRPSQIRRQRSRPQGRDGLGDDAVAVHRDWLAEGRRFAGLFRWVRAGRGGPGGRRGLLRKA